MIRKKHFSVPILFISGISLVVLLFCFGCSATSSLSCSVPDSRSLVLRPLSPSAKKGLITATSTTAWFAFAGEELSRALSSDSVLDSVEILVKTSVPADVMLAPVFTDDLTSHGRLVQSPVVRPSSLVTGVDGSVTIRMRMIPPGEQSRLAGFAVEALRSDGSGTEVPDAKTAYAEITAVRLIYSETGWESGSSGYWAGFGTSGGTLGYHEKGPVQLNNGQQAIFSFSARNDAIGTPAQPHRSVFSSGSVRFGWRASPFASNTRVFSQQLDTLPVQITPEAGTEALYAIRIRSLSDILEQPNKPIPLDPNAMITWPQQSWRNPEREIFSWDRFPSLVIFDTADYAVQAKYFKRLAFFVEKDGYVGRLMRDRDIAHLHGFNAHDYRAESLAEFFDLAEKEQFPLNPYEVELRGILLENGIIIGDNGGYLPGTGAVLSISRQSSSYLRYLFMAHEGFHGLYFTDGEFRSEMHRLYASMDPQAVDFLETYFSIVTTLGYDRTDRYLMENECMAYTLQQPLERVSRYFSGTLRERFLRYGGSEDLAAYIETTAAEDFVVLARNLESYVFSRWGLVGGRVGLWYENRN